jgi:amino acid adenylation domain-containing protein
MMNRDSLLDTLRSWAEDHADRKAFIFSAEGESEAASLTYAELDAEARSVAALLTERGLTGKRVLLMHPTGVNFVSALFGCIYAGVTAVPVVPEESTYRWRTDRLQRLVADCDPAAVLVRSDGAKGYEDSFGLPPLLHTNDLETGETSTFRPVPIDLDFPTILQYTSGSTSLPRGVMVTHRNLLANLAMLAEMFDQPAGAVSVSWLPLHHDLGLFGSVLRTVYSGGTCVLMSPMSFIRRPIRWLNAISRFGAFTSGGPNFGYDLCLQRISDQEAERLDLSCWGVAFNGAEPVRPATIEEFSRKFAASGFRRSSFSPGYGLAEATLLVAGVARGQDPTILHASSEALRGGRIDPARTAETQSTPLVSCGVSRGGLRIAIVQPETERSLGPGEVGEIWVSGETVAAGYWQDSDGTVETFGAELKRPHEDDVDRQWLRTGDLGALVDGELFVTGRIKDLIIVRGTNHYPQDLEGIGPDAFGCLRSGHGAAFVVEENGAGLVVVVHEFRPEPGVSAAAVTTAIRKRISEEHGIIVDRITLVAYGQVPKTSSGKLQRSLCRERYSHGTLKVFYEDGVGPSSQGREAGAGDAISELLGMVGTLLGRHLGPGEELAALSAIGFDSLRAIQLQELIQQHFGVEAELSQLLGGWNVVDIAGQVGDGRHREPPVAGEMSTSEAVGHSGSDHDGSFPLTDLQQAYLVGRNPDYELGGIGTQVYLEYRHRSLDLDRLAASWLDVVARHDSLRAVITPEGRQRVRLSAQDCGLIVMDLSTDPDAEEQVRLTRERMSRETRDPFVGPLFELRAYRLPSGDTTVHITFDLLMVDARSLVLVLKEWGAFYYRVAPSASVTSRSFRDFVLNRFKPPSPAIAEILRRRALDLPKGPGLPLAVDPASVGRPSFRRRSALLDAATWRCLQEKARARGVTASALLGASFSEILALYSEQREFSLTVTSFDRASTHGGADAIGEYTDLLLVTVAEAGGPFEGRVQSFSGELLSSLDQREANGLALLRERARMAGGATTPWAPVIFTSLLEEDSSGLSWLGTHTHASSRTPQVWLDHQALLDGDQVRLTWDSVDEIFPPGLLNDMFESYLHLLFGLRDNETWWLSGRRMAGLATLEPTPTFRGEGVNDGPILTLHDLVARQADRTPDAVAVISGDTRTTYAELMTAGRSLAYRLADAGIRRGDIVAIAVTKDWRQIAAVLGVLSAGAAYVPLDFDAPTRRHVDIIAESGARALISTGGRSGSLGGVRVIDVVTALGDDAPTRGELTAATPDDLAYVIYTSGSTGRPKGVAIEHRSAVNTVVDINMRFSISDKDRVLAITPLTFDLSVYDIFGILTAGGAVVMPNDTEREDPRQLAQLLYGERVTIWNSVPALLRLLWESDQDPRRWAAFMRLALLSGDWIPVRLTAAVRSKLPHVRLVSLGGATEASVWSVIYEIDKVSSSWQSIPYGRAMQNQGAHVLDGHLEPRPTWVPGPLYLSGTGLAREYWQNSERTMESFFTHAESGQRLYRTGDIARLLPDGNLELLGREDNQIKVQGNRIEPAEVEEALNRHPAVIDSVVRAVGPRDGVRRLAAYVRTAHPSLLTFTELHTHMVATVPRYLVPDLIRIGSNFPLTVNGKMDYKAMFSPASDAAEPGARIAATAGVGSTASVERKVLGIVSSTLRDVSDENVSNLSAQTSFSELALTSMHIQTVMARLDSEFGSRPRVYELHHMKVLGELIQFYQERK